MKRMHIHVAVKEIPESIKFYSTMFGVEPAVVKPDYAKWMLDDPRVNFAISQRGSGSGLNPPGLQVDNHAQLDELHARPETAESARGVAEKNGPCCYPRPVKYLVTDPAA